MRRRAVDASEDRAERRRLAQENGDEYESEEEEEAYVPVPKAERPELGDEELSEEEDLSDEEGDEGRARGGADDDADDGELANRTKVALANSLEDGAAAPTGDAILEAKEGDDDEEGDEAASLFSEEDDDEEEDEKTRVLSVAQLEELFDKAAPPLEGGWRFDSGQADR